MKNFKVDIWKLLKNNQLEMPEIHTIRNFKISSTGVSADWTQMRKESANVKVGQQLLWLKYKRKRVENKAKP